GDHAREPAAEIFVRRRRQRRNDHVGATHGLREIRRRFVQPRGSLALLGMQRDALRERADIFRAPTPEPYAMAGQEQAGGRAGCAIAAAQNRDVHRLASTFTASPRLRLRLLKRATARTAITR